MNTQELVFLPVQFLKSDCKVIISEYRLLGFILIGTN
jgi:hypothetical protein